MTTHDEQMQHRHKLHSPNSRARRRNRLYAGCFATRTQGRRLGQ